MSLPRWPAFLTLLLIVPLAHAQAPDAADPKLRAVLDAKLGCKTYVFADEQFPAIAYEQPAKVEELIGPFTLKVTFHDAKYQPVTTAKAPGVYGAVVEVTPKSGRPMQRYATLFRTATKLPADGRFTAENVDELAKQAGLDAAVVKQEAKLIADTLKDRPAEAWSADAKAARLLAGLSLQKAGAQAVRKNDDAFALERQYWVDLRRQLNGMAKAHPAPFVSPRPLDGEPARVVRAGTLAEAGMKSDAGEKIDAALQTWAADDDQAFAVCVVRHGVIVLHKAYGERDGKPMTVSTKSWMASVTKAMSASLMWQLIDQGIVSLDDPVEKYLPELRGIKVDKPLTIRHLYTHTNGLNKWPGWHDDLPDVAARLADYYPALQVGKEWAYNGTGYILGGKIIENVTGEAIPVAFRRHLLDPLGCPDTDVLGTHADAQSVPLDIAKFGQLLLNGGSYGKQRFFSAKTFEQMLPGSLVSILGPDAKRQFGIGLDGKPEKFGHGAASAATFSVDRTDDLVVIMTRNKMGKNQDKYNGKFWDAIKNGIDRSAEKPK